MTDDPKAKAKSLLDDAVAKAKPAVEQMMAGIEGMMKGLAENYGQKLDASNRAFYDALGALLLSCRGADDDGSARFVDTALRELHDAARGYSVNPVEWAVCAAVRDRLFAEDDEEAGARGLGFGPLLYHDPRQPAHRKEIFRVCAEFYAVPAEHRDRLAAMVTHLMSFHGGGGDMALWWCEIYERAVYAIVAACGFPPSHGEPQPRSDGQHRVNPLSRVH